jgi:hypothetical protein
MRSERNFACIANLLFSANADAIAVGISLRLVRVMYFMVLILSDFSSCRLRSAPAGFGVPGKTDF